ncbi:hypothetical protein [Rosistilla ulvae]|uniref:hypothetical protein n=1 Tax=Rosistilla ulvae TaxID=1930277 RepID=UPI00119CB91E|nr:hypothetical protein [Rosistilla ulvae]
MYEPTPEASIIQQPGDRRNFSFSGSPITKKIQYLPSNNLDAERWFWACLISLSFVPDNNLSTFCNLPNRFGCWFVRRQNASEAAARVNANAGSVVSYLVGSRVPDDSNLATPVIADFHLVDASPSQHG